MRRIIGIGALTIGVLIGAVFLAFTFFGASIGLALSERMIAVRMTDDYFATLPDGLHVGLCGTGAPLPDPARAGPCTLVIAGDRIFVVDSGSGSTRTLLLMGVPLGEVDAVFLTHFHSDHIADLGELMLQRWVGEANTAPLEIYGPPGVGQAVGGFNRAYVLDGGYRTAHHSADIAPPPGAGGTAIAVPISSSADASTIVIDEGGLRLTMFRVDHSPVSPAVGYRFDYRGRSVVISGDTSAVPSVPAQAAGADLLIHEALQPRMVALITERSRALGRENVAIITEDILEYHTSPEDAARAAQEAGVDALVLNHIVPPLPTPLLYPAFLGEAPSLYDGPLTVGEDGMMFSLPADRPGVIERASR